MGEAREACEPPAVCRAAPHDRGPSGPKSVAQRSRNPGLDNEDLGFMDPSSHRHCVSL